VRVVFTASDLSLEFRCDPHIAEACAARMRVRGTSTMVTGCRVHPDMLPCVRFWSM
jgi:hypothetical protein